MMGFSWQDASDVERVFWTLKQSGVISLAGGITMSAWILYVSAGLSVWPMALIWMNGDKDEMQGVWLALGYAGVVCCLVANWRVGLFCTGACVFVFSMRPF